MRFRAASTLLLVLAITSCAGSSTGDAAEPDHTHPDTTIGTPADSTGPGTPPEGVVEFGEFARDHVVGDVKYDQVPPVGGEHAPEWQTCGFYGRPFPEERGVHSMEHGAVWITYSSDLPSDQLTAIKALADGKREVLAGPFDGLPTPVVASAWGVQLQLDTALDPRLAEFADYYENGPQTPELDTPCAQGTTETD